MTAARSSTLYSSAFLGLAVELANYPLNPLAPAQGHARSRTCGSTIDLSSTHSDLITDVGMKVAACAVGQAAATIFARNSHGLDSPGCRNALAEIGDWLNGTGGLPTWPDFEAIAAARDFPGRHEAIQLPWRAALDALCKPAGDG